MSRMDYEGESKTAPVEELVEYWTQVFSKNLVEDKRPVGRSGALHFSGSNLLLFCLQKPRTRCKMGRTVYSSLLTTKSDCNKFN